MPTNSLRNCYALFIGIDQYQPPISNLNGCVQDASRMQDYLQQNIDTTAYNFYPLALLSGTDNLPTRQQIITSIQQHLGQAKEGDYAILFYAGHGSTQKAPAYFEETDDKFQVLIPSDTVLSPESSIPPILDKELRHLFHQISTVNGAKLIFLQDSCHATGASRLAEQVAQVTNKIKEVHSLLAQQDTTTTTTKEAPVARFTTPVHSDSMLDEWLNTSTEGLAAKYTAFNTALLTKIKDNLQQPIIPIDELLPLSSHIHLAACAKHQFAYEVAPSGGVFTNNLLAVLAVNQNNISYQDLFDRVRLQIGGVYEQSPSLYLPDSNFQARFEPFLGDLLRKNSTQKNTATNNALEGFSSLAYNSERGWHIATSEMTLLPTLSEKLPYIPVEVFYQGTSPKGKSNARITAVSATYSQLTFEAAAPATSEAARLLVLIPAVYLRKWRIKVGIDKRPATAIFEQHFHANARTKERQLGQLKLQWVADWQQADYYVDQTQNWLALYHKDAPQTIISKTSAVAIDDYRIESVIWLSDNSVATWHDGSIQPIAMPEAFDLTALEASTPILTKLLAAFDAQQQPIKVAAKPLDNALQHIFPELLDSSPEIANYFATFINWQPIEKADYSLQTQADGWEVRSIIEDELSPLPLFAKTRDLSKKSAVGLLRSLQKITKWETVKNLYNPLQLEALKDHRLIFDFTFWSNKEKTAAQKIQIGTHQADEFDDYERGEIIPIDIAEDKPLFFNITNQTALLFDLKITHTQGLQPLYYSTLLLDENFGILPLQPDLGCDLLPPLAVAQLHNLRLDKPLQMQQNRTLLPDAIYYVKVLVGFERFDVSSLLQTPLPPPAKVLEVATTDGSTRGHQIQLPPTQTKAGLWGSFLFPIVVE